MRNITKAGILILFSVCSVVQSFGQEDTLKRLPGKESYMTNTRYRDRTVALSVNARGAFLDIDDHDKFKYGIGTAVEFKIKDSHSLGAGLSFLFSSDWPMISAYHNCKNRLEINIGYRYYHNLRNRMSKGQTGNNFSANYFIVSPCLWIKSGRYNMDDYYWDFAKGIWVIKYTRALDLKPGIRLGYGLQRAFWRNLNFDINGGIQFCHWAYIKPTKLLYIQFSLGYLIR